jgi:hypothetical protein
LCSEERNNGVAINGKPKKGDVIKEQIEMSLMTIDDARTFGERLQQHEWCCLRRRMVDHNNNKKKHL